MASDLTPKLGISTRPPPDRSGCFGSTGQNSTPTAQPEISPRMRICTRDSCELLTAREREILQLVAYPFKTQTSARTESALARRPR